MNMRKSFLRLAQQFGKVFTQVTALPEKDWDDLNLFGPLAS